jgi:hypothetical protein
MSWCRQVEHNTGNFIREIITASLCSCSKMYRTVCNGYQTTVLN